MKSVASAKNNLPNNIVSEQKQKIQEKEQYNDHNYYSAEVCCAGWCFFDKVTRVAQG
jgi:hypothetical protein